jgi:hypothetical protein
MIGRPRRVSQRGLVYVYGTRQDGDRDLAKRLQPGPATQRDRQSNPAAVAATIRDQGFAKPTPSGMLANEDSTKWPPALGLGAGHMDTPLEKYWPWRTFPRNRR